MSPGENGRGSGAEPTTFCTSLSTSISRCRSNNIADRGDLYTPIWQAYLDQLVVATKFCIPANALRLLLLAEFNVLPTSHRFILVTTPFPVPRSPFTLPSPAKHTSDSSLQQSSSRILLRECHAPFYCFPTKTLCFYMSLPLSTHILPVTSASSSALFACFSPHLDVFELWPSSAPRHCSGHLLIVPSDQHSLLCSLLTITPPLSHFSNDAF